MADPMEPGCRTEDSVDLPAGTPAAGTPPCIDNYPPLRRMSPPDLLITCYAGAIRRLREAIDLAQQERADLGRPKYACAGRILTRLRETLNPNAGELAVKLASLYSFLIDEINRADGERDPQIAGDCIEILTTLRDGWEDMTVDAESLTPEGHEDYRGRNTADRDSRGAQGRNNRRPHPTRRLAAKGKR